MSPREVLLKMLEWIGSEQLKARQPNAEKFVLTSLTFCAGKVADEASAAEAVRLLQMTTKIERQVKTHDVVEPQVARFIINRALATQC